MGYKYLVKQQVGCTEITWHVDDAFIYFSHANCFSIVDVHTLKDNLNVYTYLLFQIILFIYKIKQ